VLRESNPLASKEAPGYSREDAIVHNTHNWRIVTGFNSLPCGATGFKPVCLSEGGTIQLAVEDRIKLSVPCGTSVFETGEIVSHSHLYQNWREAVNTIHKPCGPIRFPDEAVPCTVYFPKWRRASYSKRTPEGANRLAVDAHDLMG